MSTAEVMHSSQKLTSQQLRKIKKPIIEKRRRERINESLNQLKTLVLDALNKDESQYNKMEKADILEMTVKHLKSLQQRLSSKSLGTESSPVTVNRYKSGFKECTQEVTRYLESLPTVHPQVKQHLNNHLNICASKVAVPDNTVVDKSVKNEYYGSTKPIIHGQIEGIQVGLPVVNSGSQPIMLATTGSISPGQSSHGLVPVILSPNNSVSIVTPPVHNNTHIHQHQQPTSPLPGNVIPLYTNSSQLNTIQLNNVNKQSNINTTFNFQMSPKYHQSNDSSSPVSTCSSPSSLQEVPSSPVLAEVQRSMYSDEGSHVKALNFYSDNSISKPERKSDSSGGSVNKQHSFQIQYSNLLTPKTHLHESWAEYPHDLLKYERDILVQSPNSNVWRPW